MTKLEEKRAELEAKRAALHGIFEEAGEDFDLSKVKSLEGDTRVKAAEIKRRNDEMADLGKEVEELVAVEKAAADTKAIGEFLNAPAGGMVHPSAGAGKAERTKSLGELVMESPAFKAYKGGGRSDVAELDVELKTTFARGDTTGWLPETIRTGRVVEFATRPPQVLDLIPQTTTGQAAVAYMEETTFTNAAAEALEAGVYIESALALTARTSIVQKIATYLPVTDEQLEDVPQAQDYINNRLLFMLKQRLDLQILVGNGTNPNLRGILNVVNVQSQAKGADPTPDAIYKAMTLVRITGRATPSAIVMHPNDWQAVRLLRTTDGIYIWGSPADPGAERIWGLPVVQSDAITEGVGLVGDFPNFCELASRRGMDIQVSNSEASYFIHGMQAIRADVRAAFVVYRPTAFCMITGI